MKTCECGCGQATSISPVTVSRRGWVKGQPKRFVQGHHAKPAERIERINCACGCGEVIEWAYRHHAYRPKRLPGHTTPALQAKYARQRSAANPNPSGLCQCGCGEATEIARWTDARSGSVKGTRRRFLPHHQLRGIKRGEGRYLNSQGYVLLRMPGHPHAVKGYVLEHRWVMEQKLGRPLERDEHVHHLNHRRADNRPENLAVLDPVAHAKYHTALPRRPQTPEHREKARASMTRVWAERTEEWIGGREVVSVRLPTRSGNARS